MKQPDRLETYRQKRRFEKTPEPAGGKSRRRKAKVRRYVIQKHAARALHYDFRLEHDGVLLSWSVPKGPSLKPSDRRLAVRTEDHPLEYADFEGVIPKGEYGGGTVMLWDTGSWEPEGDPEDGLKKGRLTFDLHGRKLKGRWHLVRTRLDGGRRENWLLFKGRDEAADDSANVLDAKQSVASGRSLEEIGSARDRVWHSNRATPAEIVSQLPVGFRFTNLEKVLYREQGITKAELIAYYALVSDWILPHVAGRPLTLVRCPDGYDRSCFFQKHANAGVPKAVDRIEIAEEDGGTGTYMAIHDLPGLLAAPQLGALELHTWVSRVEDLEHPDQLVFDLDPGPDARVGGGRGGRAGGAAAARRPRPRELRQDHRRQGPARGGARAPAPLVGRALGVRARAGRRDGGRAARALHDQRAQGAAQGSHLPRLPAQRPRSHGDRARTRARARAGAPVATPLGWSELEGGIDPREFTIASVPKRLDALRKDPWAAYAKLRQSIRATGRAAARRSARRRS